MLGYSFLSWPSQDVFLLTHIPWIGQGVWFCGSCEVTLILWSLSSKILLQLNLILRRTLLCIYFTVALDIGMSKILNALKFTIVKSRSIELQPEVGSFWNELYLFFAFSERIIVVNENCRWLDWNCRYLISETDHSAKCAI